MKNYLKRLAVLGVLSIITGTLSGCNSPSSAGSPDKLVIWSQMSDKEIAVVQKVADDWSRKTGNKVVIYSDKGDNRAFMEAAEDGNGPDIEFGVNHSRLEKLHSENLLSEAPSSIIDKTKFIDSAVQTVSFDGNMYGVPLSITTYGLYYNKSMIKVPPKTFDEFMSLAQKYGFQYDINSIYFSYSFLGGNGAYVFNKVNGKYDVNDTGLDNAGAIKGFTFLRDMVNKYKFMTTDIDTIKSRKNFENGKTGFYLSGSWDIEEMDEKGVNYSVCPMPEYNGKLLPTFVSVETAFVSSKSSKQQKSWEFLKYMAENSEMPLFKIGGKMPTLKAALNDPLIKSNEKVNAFLYQAENGGEALPNVVEVQALQDTRIPLQDLTSGKITPTECAKKITDVIKEFIKNEKAK
jgi:arabinogalactan oligomer / maltooligosaccharide transport system substrate-binding protein